MTQQTKTDIMPSVAQAQSELKNKKNLKRQADKDAWTESLDPKTIAKVKQIQEALDGSAPPADIIVLHLKETKNCVDDAVMNIMSAKHNQCAWSSHRKETKKELNRITAPTSKPKQNKMNVVYVSGGKYAKSSKPQNMQSRHASDAKNVDMPTAATTENHQDTHVDTVPPASSHVTIGRVQALTDVNAKAASVKIGNTTSYNAAVTSADDVGIKMYGPVKMVSDAAQTTNGTYSFIDALKANMTRHEVHVAAQKSKNKSVEVKARPKSAATKKHKREQPGSATNGPEISRSDVDAAPTTSLQDNAVKHVTKPSDSTCHLLTLRLPRHVAAALFAQASNTSLIDLKSSDRMLNASADTEQHSRTAPVGHSRVIDPSNTHNGHNKQISVRASHNASVDAHDTAVTIGADAGPKIGIASSVHVTTTQHPSATMPVGAPSSSSHVFSDLQNFQGHLQWNFSAQNILGSASGHRSSGNHKDDADTAHNILQDQRTIGSSIDTSGVSKDASHVAVQGTSSKHGLHVSSSNGNSEDPWVRANQSYRGQTMMAHDDNLNKHNTKYNGIAHTDHSTGLDHTDGVVSQHAQSSSTYVAMSSGSVKMTQPAASHNTAISSAHVNAINDVAHSSVSPASLSGMGLHQSPHVMMHSHPTSFDTASLPASGSSAVAHSATVPTAIDNLVGFAPAGMSQQHAQRFSTSAAVEPASAANYYASQNHHFNTQQPQPAMSSRRVPTHSSNLITATAAHNTGRPGIGTARSDTATEQHAHTNGHATYNHASNSTSNVPALTGHTARAGSHMHAMSSSTPMTTYPGHNIMLDAVNDTSKRSAWGSYMMAAGNGQSDKQALMHTEQSSHTALPVQQLPQQQSAAQMHQNHHVSAQGVLPSSSFPYGFNQPPTPYLMNGSSSAASAVPPNGFAMNAQSNHKNSSGAGHIHAPQRYGQQQQQQQRHQHPAVAMHVHPAHNSSSATHLAVNPSHIKHRGVGHSYSVTGDAAQRVQESDWNV